MLHKHFTSRRHPPFLAVWCFWCLFSAALVLVEAQVLPKYCDRLEKNTWTELVQLLDFAVENSGVVFPCGFEIKGSNCPANGASYRLKTGASLQIVCGAFVSGSRACTINCANTHFVVPNGASLSLDGLSFMGSKSTAVEVVGGSLDVSNCHFSENNNSNGNGGALVVASGSSATIRSSSFVRNQANKGGAILANGAVTLIDTEVVGNVADVSGGAVFVASSGRVSFRNCKVDGNRAKNGPAVSGSANDVASSGTSGCWNRNGDADYCDGVETSGNQCVRFDDACVYKVPRTPRPSPRPPRPTNNPRPVRESDTDAEARSNVDVTLEARRPRAHTSGGDISEPPRRRARSINIRNSRNFEKLLNLLEDSIDPVNEPQGDSNTINLEKNSKQEQSIFENDSIRT